MNITELKAQKAQVQKEAERRLKRMGYARLSSMSGRGMEKFCDALGLDTTGYDEQLQIRLQEHKKKLSPP